MISLKRLAVLAAGLGTMLLAGCVEPPPPLSCPAVRVLQQPGSLTRFKPGDGRDITDILFQAEFTGLAGDCLIGEDDVALDFTVEITAQRGPADTEKRADMSMFMAVRDPERKILSREEFEVQVPFDGNQTRVILVEEFEASIPLASGNLAEDYTVFVGFVLSREELEFNREQLDR